jgi:hypothetical protein
MTFRSAYFPNFKGGPKVLFWGDTKAIADLAALIRQCLEDFRSLDLTSRGHSVDGRAIILMPSTFPKGMQFTGSRFEWFLDRETMLQFVEMLDSLAKAEGPGHQYLDTLGPEEITVMASSGEYPDTLSP